MANKITAVFGADISEVEQKMMAATRATKYYENAVKAVGASKVVPQDLSSSLSKANESLSKGLNLLRGGAIAASLSLVVGRMKEFSQAAKEMGDEATDAQKSAAKWGDEFQEFSSTVTGWGASALGTLAQWGRNVGTLFRDPVDMAYDDVAASSEEAAKRQEAALAKTREATKKAAEEIPDLLKKLAEAQRNTANVGRLDMDIMQEDLLAVEKEIARVATLPGGAINRAKLIQLETTRQGIIAKIKEADQKRAAEANLKDGQAVKEIAALEAQADAEEEKRVKELAELRYQAIWRYASLEQRLAQARKEGIEAQAKAERDASSANLIALEKARDKYRDILAEIEAKNNAEEKGRKAEAEAGGFTTRSGNVKVSAEDRARSERSREVAARRTEEAISGQVRSTMVPGERPRSAQSPMKTTEGLLGEIASYLKPTDAAPNPSKK